MTVSMDSKVLENFYKTTHQKGLVKSAVIAELVKGWLQR
jgi:hypothetical protein